MVKWIFVFLCIFFVIGCGPSHGYNKIVALDISGSNEAQVSADVEKTVKFLNNTNKLSKIAYFCFNDKAYDLYMGDRPAKDRELVKVVVDGTKEAQKVDCHPGTNILLITQKIDHAIDVFQSNKLTNDIYILTDGFFELSSSEDWNETKKIIEKWDNTSIHKVYISGINLKNKDNIKQLFGKFEKTEQLEFL